MQNTCEVFSNGHIRSTPETDYQILIIQMNI